jgi:alpha-D-ribose 1-methylphosphonate 5-triphosphate synthase subunit PhnG
MNRKTRTEILIKGPVSVPQKLAREILSRYEVRTIEDANNGLVMIKVREGAKQSLFYIGEVLVTECKVMLNGCLGIGIVKGHEPELAYNLAVIDAAYNAGLAETKAWTSELLLEEERIKKNDQDLAARILKTKVNFTTMDV